MVDACRRASAARITAVVPYFGYSRQDRRPACDSHGDHRAAGREHDFGCGCEPAVDGRSARRPDPGILRYPGGQCLCVACVVGRCMEAVVPNKVIVSPDVGGVVRARAFAKRLDDAELAIIDKRRPRPNESKVMNIIGEVEGKTCVLVDDMIDTAGTLCLAAQALKDDGATKVVAYITHAVLSGAAVEKIMKSALDELIVTDTIPLSAPAKACGRIRQLSVAALLAETIRRIRDEESVSSLYVD